ncbi:MAG TPA: hypothetical protein VEA63_02010, partial [Opitutus sp.]|nr:hypothetical protein [Opitutus sp.]
ATIREVYREYDLEVLEILGGYAPRLPFLGEVENSPFPTNYHEVYRSWRTIAEKFKHTWGAEETWNEPDLVPVPADQFTSLAKVAAAAMSDAGVTVSGGGAFASVPPSAFFDTCAANGFLDHVDYVSFHTYSPAIDLPAIVTRYRRWLGGVRKDALPLWLTESGQPWSIGPSRPPLHEDALSAMEIAMKGIEAKACGVARYFPFVYVYYEEGGIKNFGMLGHEATPLRSMAAYVQSIRALSSLEYLGDIESKPDGIKVGRFFGRRDERAPHVLVLYTGQIDGSTVVKLPFRAARAEGMDGRVLPLESDGSMMIPDGLAYLWIDRATAETLIKTDTSVARLHLLGKQSQVAPAERSKVILRYEQEHTPSQRSAQRYLLKKEVARNLPISVRIENLDKADRRITAQLRLPGVGEAATWETKTIDVPAHGFARLAWRGDASNHLDTVKVSFITISATSDRSVPISPLVLPFVVEGSLEAYLAGHAKKERLPAADLARWRTNVAPNGKMKLSASPEAWRMDVAFDGGGSWAFPQFELPSHCDLETATGIVLRARILHPARHVTFYAQINERERFQVADVFPADGEWHSVFIPFSELVPSPGHVDMQNARLDPKRIAQLSLGFVANGLSGALEI